MHVRVLCSGVTPLHPEASELKRHTFVPHILNIRWWYQDRKTLIDTPIQEEEEQEVHSSH